MARFYLSLFGSPRLLCGDDEVSIPAAKERVLLAVLAVAPGSAHRRESLAGLLWPGYTEASARDSLSHALYNLNRILHPLLEADDPPPLIATRTEVRLNDAALRSDAQAWDALLGAWRRHGHGASTCCGECAVWLREALALYRGPLLHGASLRDAPEFEEWLVAQRERIHRQAVQAAGALARHGEDEDALSWAQRWAELDPLDEDAHRRAMTLLAGNGRRAEALAHYEAARQTLLAELGVEPEEATRALQARIRAGEHTPVPHNLPAQAAGDRRAPMPSHNLPAAVDSFVGREREMSEVQGLLRDLAVRLVTLSGAGGMGKTRLALESARGLLCDFTDGVWFVDLAPLPATRPGAEPDETAVRREFAAVMGVREDTGIEGLVGALQGRRLLLLVDNCEHVLEAAATLIASLLVRCPHLTILATSREPLRTQGERLYLVPPLACPEPVAAGQGRAVDPAAALEYGAVRLLADRGAAARYGATLDGGNLADALEVCRRLDGMPLAIELAAARLNGLTLHELADGLDGHLAGRLHQRWGLLNAGSRAAHPRQQTMLNTVAWSYGLLGEDERLLFDRLSVFVGSYSLEAAVAVCAGGDVDARQGPLLLAALVDCSLVQRIETAGASRYRLLETLRAFGQERLAERGEADEIARKHAQFFASLAESAAPVLRHGEPDYFRVLHSLTPDRDNLEEAIRWSLRSGTGEEALRITGAAHFWAMHNRYMPRYMAWAQQALERIRDRPGVCVPPLIRARALDTIANQLFNWTRLDEMERACIDQRAAALDAEDPSALAWVGWYDARLAMMRGQSAVSDAHFSESLAIARDCGENGLAAWLGLYVAGHEPVARRIALMDRILERTPEGFQAFAFQLAADLIVGAGEFARAERYYTVSIGRWAEAGNIPMVGALKWMLASTLAPRGRLAQAAGLLDQGAQEGRGGGDMVAWVRASSVRCELAWLAQEPAAADLFHAYLRDPAAFGPNWFGAIHRLMLVKVAYGLGDRDLGCRLEGDALTQLTPGTALAMHLVGEARGWGAFLMGDMPAAAAAFRRALAELRGSELRPAVASNREHLAWVLGELGEIRGAAALLAQAASEREAMGMVLYPVEVPYHERAVALVADRVT